MSIPQQGISLSADQMYNDHKRLFREYISNEYQLDRHPDFVQNLEDILSQNSSRLLIGIESLNKFSHGVSSRILDKPIQYILPFEDALFEWAESTAIDNTNLQDKKVNVDESFARLKIGFTNVIGRNHVTPRGLMSEHLNHLISVNGVVTRCTTRKTKKVLTFSYSENGDMLYREWMDPVGLSTFTGGSSGVDSSRQTEQVDANSGKTLKYTPLYGISLFRDFQYFVIQEAPESTPPGLLPRSVECIVADDLVDQVKPGDRVCVSGVYLAKGSGVKGTNDGGIVSGIMRTCIVVNSITPIVNSGDNTIDLASLSQLAQKSSAPQSSLISSIFTRQEVTAMINLVAAAPNTLEILASSFAPTIACRDYEKCGLILQLLGGCEKGSVITGSSSGDEHHHHIRGDIHILLVGDPSCGKSQLLRFAMKLSPISISTTGRGSTSVGLTAAVVVDKENPSENKTLEAGATVLADRGLICIDEFDKMNSTDRVAIHEVMEQQTVTISKAGIHTCLNARCSILAAANPIYGNFDASLDLARNINLQDSLLSRFDLIYVVRDFVSIAEDRKIARQILKQMINRPSDETNAAQARSNNRDNSDYTIQPNNKKSKKTTNSEDENNMIPPNMLAPSSITQDGKSILSVEFLKKYIAYCKHCIPPPKLSDEAAVNIAHLYRELRQKSTDSPSATPVSIRHLEGMIRLSSAHAKSKMREYVLIDDVEAIKNLIYITRGEIVKSNNKKRNIEEDEEEPSKRERNIDVENIEPSNVSSLSDIDSSILNAFTEEGVQMLKIEDLLSKLSDFSEGDIHERISILQKANKVMLAEGFLFLI